MKNSKIFSLFLVILFAAIQSCKQKQVCKTQLKCPERKFILTDSLGNDILTDNNMSKIHLYFLNIPDTEPEFHTEVDQNRHIINVNLYPPTGKDSQTPCGKNEMSGYRPIFQICIESVAGRKDTIDVEFGIFNEGKDKVYMTPIHIKVNGHHVDNSGYRSNPCAHKDDIIEIRR